mgnify:FL=1
MNTFITANVLDSIVPINRFYNGDANSVFADVKKYGTRIVVKDNVPECVLLSPENYKRIMEEYENATLEVEAEKRFVQNVKYVDHDDVMKRFGLTDSDLDDVEVDLE